MRQRRTVQRSIFENYAEHEIGLRLEKISDILDEQPEILELVEQDLDDIYSKGLAWKRKSNVVGFYSSTDKTLGGDLEQKIKSLLKPDT